MNTTSAGLSATKRAVIQDTASALRVTQLEGLREKIQTITPAAATAASDLSIPVRINPFTHRDRIDSWEMFKVICGFVFVPIRVIFAILCLFITFGLFKLSTLGFDHKNKPLTGWRYGLQYFANAVFYRGMLFFFGLLWINVKGKPSKDCRCVVAAPHSTWVDGFILSNLLVVGSPVAKAEVARSSCMLRTLLESSQAILVDRHSAEGRQGALQAIVARMNSDLHWRHMFLFPEGTCTNRKALINFKVGAFVAGKPVQPVVFNWERNTNFNPTWTSGGPNRVWLIYRFLCQVMVKVDVEFMEPYFPNEEEQADAALYAASVRQIMANKLGVTTTEHSYEDSFMAALAYKQRLNPDTTLPHEFAKLNKLHNISYQDATRLMRRFAEVRKKSSLQPQQPPVVQNGQIVSSRNALGLEDFAKLLELPLTDPVIDFFYYLDVTGDGQIDFLAFLIGLSFLSQQSNVEDCANLIWVSLEQDKNARVEVKVLQQALDEVLKRTVTSNWRGGARRRRHLPLLREHKSQTISLPEFIDALKLHPEYMPIALQFVGTTQASDSSAEVNRRLSIATANAKLKEKDVAYKNALQMSDERKRVSVAVALEQYTEDSLA